MGDGGLIRLSRPTAAGVVTRATWCTWTSGGWGGSPNAARATGPTLTAHDAIAFLRRAVAWFAEREVVIRAVISDNGSAYLAHAPR